MFNRMSIADVIYKAMHAAGLPEEQEQRAMAAADMHRRLQNENQYYGPNIESQIAQRKAMERHLGAQSGLLGRQDYAQQLKNQIERERVKSIMQLIEEAQGSQGGQLPMQARNTPAQQLQPNQQYSSGPPQGMGSGGQTMSPFDQTRGQEIPNLMQAGNQAVSPFNPAERQAPNQFGVYSPARPMQQTGQRPDATLGQQMEEQHPMPEQWQQATKARRVLDVLNAAQNKRIHETPEEKRLRGLELAEKKSKLRISEAESKENLMSYAKTTEDAHDSGKDAIQMKNLIDQFNSSYSKLGEVEKGPLRGNIPSFSTEAQKADNAAKNMQQMMLKLMKTNRLTNYELKFAGELKLNRNMTDKARIDIGNFLKAKSNRMLEEEKFFDMAEAKNIPIRKARAAWNEYDNNMPVYNFEKNKVNKENMNKYAEYLKPKALNAAYENSLRSAPSDLGSAGNIDKAAVSASDPLGIRG